MHLSFEELKKYKLVLWDVDGTILNFKEAQKNAIRACFLKFGMGECSDGMLEVYDGINHKYWEALEKGEISKQEVLRGRFFEFFDKFGLNTGVVDAFNSEYQIRLGDTICFYPGVKELLFKIKQAGILQFAVTNGTKRAQEIKLEKSGLKVLLDAVFISEDIGFEKPSVDFFAPVYQEAQRRVCGITPRDILIIGDSYTSDIQLGRNTGIKTCIFCADKSENRNGTEFSDYEIEDFSDIK